MFNFKNSCSVLCVLLFNLGDLSNFVDTLNLSEPKFEILKPLGLRISIEDEPGLEFFAFHGNVNKRIKSNQLGEIFGESFQAENGIWSIENSTVKLRHGDVINYWIYVQVRGSMHWKENGTWTALIPESQVKRSTTTERTKDSPAQLLIEDQFNSLNSSIWGRDVKMSLAPDYEFCVYHNANHQSLVEIEDGMLRIQPLILEDYYGENATAYGRMQLHGCTSNIPAECTRQALSYNILPPVISARLTTRESFSFRYGKIEIRAKFPEGDWIYPEMWLAPKFNSYGHGYTSGRVLLGLSRGNGNLVNITNGAIFDSRKLEFGLRVGPPSNISEYIVSKINENHTKWNRDFHVYTTLWTANGFQFFVDGKKVGQLHPETNGWLESNTGSSVAPFDQEFYLVLGVGIGGVRVFPDETRSSGYVKPWRNVGAKAMLKFWHSRNDWLPSWRREKGKRTAFKIDYVRVWSF